MDETAAAVAQPLRFQGGQSGVAVITENYQFLLEELPGLELAQSLHSNGILSESSFEKIVSRRTTKEANELILEGVQNATLQSESAFEQFLRVLQEHRNSAYILKRLCESVERNETLSDELEIKSSLTPTSSRLQMKHTNDPRSSSSSSGYSFHCANSGEPVSQLCSSNSTTSLSTRFCTPSNGSQLSTVSQSKKIPANCLHASCATESKVSTARVTSLRLLGYYSSLVCKRGLFIPHTADLAYCLIMSNNFTQVDDSAELQHKMNQVTYAHPVACVTMNSCA